MPHSECDYLGGDRQAATTAWTIDTSLGVRPRERACRGKRVAVWVDVIKADKRDEWERLIHEVLGPAAQREDPEALRRIRFLEPALPNDDGTWTYVIMPFHYPEGVECDIRLCVGEAFGHEKADAFERSWDECHAVPQYGWDLFESAW